MAKRTEPSNPYQLDLFDSWDEPRLIAACLALGAKTVGQWTGEEEAIAQNLPTVSEAMLGGIRESISRGDDPLGELFCGLRSPATRRTMGATYTPLPIVQQMVRGAKSVGDAGRVVDPGCGSARFLRVAAHEFPRAELIGFEIDPVASIMAKANLAVSGLASRANVVLKDFRAAELPPIGGRTLFIGNPPYIRHHLLSQDWKEWLVRSAGKMGFKASQLAGLHVHFFLATALSGQPGDFGVFITAGEWLEVNYGSVVRDLFLNPLGGTGITVIEPTAMPFPDAATTAAVTSFQVGTKPEVVALARVESVSELSAPKVVRRVKRERLEAEPRWMHLTRGAKDMPSDFIELGELCRVHRGTVTGANRIWIAGDHSAGLPQEFLFSTVTKGRELTAAGFELVDATSLKNVIDLPDNLDTLDGEARKAVDKFLRYAKAQGGDAGYIARTRRAWWSVGLRKPAPVLATYMARRPPSFVRNRIDARHINIAHGLYPREKMPEQVIEGLVRFLSSSVSVANGRTYAGGLTKFEPREMERLLVPRPDVICAYANG